MKKLKLFFAALALLVGGANSASADTALLTAGDGWQKITEMPADVSNYYFVIVDDASDLMLSIGNAVNNNGHDKAPRALFYKTSAAPSGDFTKVWTLTAHNSYYALRNLDFNTLYLQTEWGKGYLMETNDVTSPNEWTDLKFEYNAGSWTIENGKYPLSGDGAYKGYLGPWMNTTQGNIIDGQELAANKDGDNIGKFQIYAITKTDFDKYIWNTSKNFTYKIINSSFETNGTKQAKDYGWTRSGTATTDSWGYNGNGAIEIYHHSLTLKQTITGLPAGKYGVSLQMVSGEGSKTAYIYGKITSGEPVKANVMENAVNSGGGAFDKERDRIAADPTLGKETVNLIVEDGSLEIGFVEGAENSWIVFDNFTLSYLDPSISALATEITAASPTSLTAGGWYKFTAASTDNYSFAASAVGDIIYTDADQLNSVATGTAASAIVALTGGTTYYIKSTSAQTLTITPQTFTYNVGDGTSSVADDQYTQNKTFTLTFSESSTDDPAGEFQILDASKITVNGTAATASLTDKVLTITLADPLAVSTNYAISVAAGAVGYKADAANDPINLTVHTPAVFDGHYYIKKDGEDLYFSRGGSENKQTVLDAFGVPVKITTDASNMSRVKFVDTGLLLGASGSSTMYWTDKGTDTPAQINWTITKSGEKYKFYLMGMENAKKGMNIDGNAPKSDTEVNACTWELELPAAHPAKLQAVKDAQAATVATAMGFDGVTTQAQMKTYLETNYGETSIEITGTGGTNKEAWQQTAPIEAPFEYAVFAEETVDDLKPGLYRLRVYGFERIAGGQAVYDAGGAAGLAYVYATSNSVTEKVKLTSLFDVQSDTPWKAGNDLEFGGKYYANGQEGAQNAFNAGNYANDVYVKVVDEGEGTGSIKFGIKQPNAYYSSSSVHNNSQWICYNDFSLVKFDAKPTAEEKTALATAISTAEGKTLGFEDGKYAPYSNIDAIEKLAEAKAINPETASRVVVVDATTALKGATWTPNDGDVECVYNGNMENVEANVPTGWTRSSNWGTRVDYGDPKKYGFYNQPGSLQYGNAGVYTMPLKAQTIYTLTFKYASQATNSNNGIKVSVLKDEEGMAEISYEENNTKYDEADAFVTKTVKFVTGTAGNYVLKITNDGNSVITDVSITKAASQVLEFADGSVPAYAPGTYPSVKITRTLTADKWASAIYPFAVSATGLTVATLSSFKDSQLDFSTANPSTANKPFLMKSASDLTEISLSNVAVSAAAASPVEEGGVTFTGVYSSTPIDDSAVNYVLSSNKLYKVGTAGATMNPYRAYFTVAGASSVKPLSFVIDGTATGVDSVEAAEAEEDGALYNTAGQQVTEDYKGIVIKNGKKYYQK